MGHHGHLKWDSQNDHTEHKGSMNRKRNAINLSTGLPGPLEGWTDADWGQEKWRQHPLTPPQGRRRSWIKQQLLLANQP